VFEQVLATYMAIRDKLAGFNPGVNRTIQTQQNTIYHRQFQDINGTPFGYRVGDGDFTQFDSSINNLIPGRGADRLARQAGFSVSDSYFHLDRLEDIGNNAQTDRLGNPVVPLLWSQDNTLPLTFNTRVIDPRATDEDRAFFRDRETIFGANNNSLNNNNNNNFLFDQFIGRAFLEEKILHQGRNFFDTAVATDTDLLKGVRDQRFPAGGTRVLNGITMAPAGTSPFVSETANIPETGTPTTGKTLRKWQMI